MNKIKLKALVRAALVLASALALFFLARYRGRPGAGPAAVPPAEPAAAVVKAKKPVRRKAAVKVNASPAVKGAVTEKPGGRRKKRVSKLQEPGEALGGGVYLDLPGKKTGSMR